MSSHLTDLIVENKKQVIAMRKEIIAEARLLYQSFWEEHHQRDIPWEVKMGKGYFIVQFRERERSEFPELELYWGRRRLVRMKEGGWKPWTKPIRKGKGSQYPMTRFTNPEPWELEMINRYETKAAKIREVSQDIGKISSSLNRLIKHSVNLEKVLDYASLDNDGVGEAHDTKCEMHEDKVPFKLKKQTGASVTELDKESPVLKEKCFFKGIRKNV